MNSTLFPAGTLTSGWLSQHGHLSSPGKFHVDKVSTHAPSDAIIVSDAHLLFNGDFKRSGVDLILTSGDRELVLHDYFKGEKRAALASPDGAHLTGDLVNALTGHTQFAQADGSASVAPPLIGHVTKLTGNATAIRNGVSIILNQGDNVHKGDVVQSGSDSTLGITFIDGTVFGLASNAKMVLNEMIYDPNGSDNKSLLSLVAGTISFVAGATAKKGDMKVDTPVATMGIRGTAVLVEIDFEVPSQGGAPPAKFQVLVEPDGTTGSYILYDKTTLTQIATVNQRRHADDHQWPGRGQLPVVRATVARRAEDHQRRVFAEVHRPEQPEHQAHDQLHRLDRSGNVVRQAGQQRCRPGHASVRQRPGQACGASAPRSPIDRPFTFPARRRRPRPAAPLPSGST